MKRNKKTTKLNKLLNLMIVVLIMVVAGQLYLMNKIDLASIQVSNLVSQYSAINIQNQTLQGEVSSAQSIMAIKNTVLKNGYKSIKSVQYVPGGTYSFNLGSGSTGSGSLGASSLGSGSTGSKTTGSN